MLPSVLREQHWHDRLSTAYQRRPPAIIATTAADYLTHTGKTPAEDVWQVFGNTSPRQRLIDLPYTDPDHDAQWRPATPR
ncbi:hypothetical protein [Micromonospora thermarum]|uniref:Uncharacterized protein n=1 Tax=Micromonospora thermarum TaxID=2720024 RepID=A0ABX0ZBC5_9ACTN|nr:hypothetical protein [Micromonospora thermarum]NJP35215.1 hypothetical protein [Micromonospora thermarum]